LDLSDDEVHQGVEADRREIDPPIQVETAMWSKAGQPDWWVKERREWWDGVRGADGRQRWIRAVDLCPASGSGVMIQEARWGSGSLRERLSVLSGA
jgi:hypothetical protein